MILSIIIPVYNVEKYVEKCISSVAEQDVPTSLYEILIVNDGSTDSSLSVIEETSKKYGNVSIINKANGGQGSARNIGLDRAKGKYVWMIDSDDWISRNSLRQIMDKLTGVDVLVIGYTIVIGEKVVQKKLLFPDNKIISGLDFLHKFYIYPFSGVPFSIIRKDLLDEYSLRFKEDILFEDDFFTPFVFFYSKRVDFDKSPIYNYYKRSGSSMNCKSYPKQCYDILYIASQLLLFANTRCDNIIDKRMFYKLIAKESINFYQRWKTLQATERKTLKGYFFQQKDIIRAILLSRNMKSLSLFLLLR